LGEKRPLHRLLTLTGSPYVPAKTPFIVLAVGSLGLLWVLVSLSLGEEAFSATRACLASGLGQLALFAYSACLMYHFFNGIRHLFWDAGKGFAIPDVYRSGYAVIGLATASTLGLWWLALQGGVA
jgi:succinate dehydrogenase / fumarate reductase, cytochrome b subunit